VRKGAARKMEGKEAPNQEAEKTAPLRVSASRAEICATKGKSPWHRKGGITQKITRRGPADEGGGGTG